jgi:site-specific DNA recombinase
MREQDRGREGCPIRCAIYTRKSTEDGLEQAFNSLDAQREACAAYITSQRHEGWTLVPDLYDDGGFSGGSMERPGLKRLLADIEAGRVDVIVVYKVDRLTRSLADFAKIVDVLDAKGASFVSITQAFNTTTSMGRLTLNVLLSFAQFEREVTGERIRDKIAASKKKGLWMGGPVPLGYDVQDRKLIVNESEAETVRHIMQRYLALGSVKALVVELAVAGRVTKVQVRSSGTHRGGIAFARGMLFHLLKNRIYRGEIVHKGVSHRGEHPAIVPEDLWDAVQRRLAERAHARRLGSGAEHPSLLVGLLRDSEDRPMSPSHAVKGAKRYRYYVTHEAHVTPDHRAQRIAAHDVEQIVTARLASYLGDPAARLGEQPDADADVTSRMVDATAASLNALTNGTPVEQRAVVLDHIETITLHDDRVEIALRSRHANTEATTPILTTPVARKRRGHEIRLVIPGPAAPRVHRDERLVQLLAEAHAARTQVLGIGDASLVHAAAALGCCRTGLGQHLRLSFLAPDIVEAILAGKQPKGLTRKRLAAIDLPSDWHQQRTMLGFA